MSSTNLQIATRIKSDLNELIDKRGNTQLIPALILIQEFINDIHRLISILDAMRDEYGE